MKSKTIANKRDVPHLMRLPDGRRLYAEIPVQWTVKDKSGRLAFLPPAVRLLDQIRAAAMALPLRPSPGHVRALRDALGLTQQQFAERIGVNKLTVSRWERGRLRPNVASVRSLERVRNRAVRHGIVIAA